MSFTYADSSIADCVSRLPSISTANLAPPAADILVRPELAAVYLQLVSDIDKFSGKLRGTVLAAATAGCPQAEAAAPLTGHVWAPGPCLAISATAAVHLSLCGSAGTLLRPALTWM